MNTDILLYLLLQEEITREEHTELFELYYGLTKHLRNMKNPNVRAKFILPTKFKELREGVLAQLLGEVLPLSDTPLEDMIDNIEVIPVDLEIPDEPKLKSVATSAKTKH